MQRVDRALPAPRMNRRVFSAGAAVGLLAATRLEAMAQTPSASPAATPGASPAAGTPAVSGKPGSLAAMLTQVPDLFAASPSESANMMVTYANVAAQAAAVQVPIPTSLDQVGYPFTAVLQGLLLPDQLGTHYLMPEWQELFGFSPLEVDQAVQAGVPPDRIMLFRGRFNDAQIAAALTKSGYKQVAVAGLTAYSLHADASLDMTSAVTQLVLANMNNGVRLPDGTWAFASTLALLRAVVSSAQGQATSLASRADIRAALAVPSSELASAVIIPGTMLRLDVAGIMLGPSTSPQAIAQIQHQLEQYGKMPPVGLALLATTVGGPLPPPAGGGTPPIPSSPSIQPVSQAEITLVMATPAAAQSAVPIIEKRLAGMKSFRTEQPYKEFFPNPAVEAVANQPMVRLTLLPAQGRQPSVIFQMLFSRDLGFVAW